MSTTIQITRKELLKAYCLNGAQNGIITANDGHSLYVPRPDIEAAQQMESNNAGHTPDVEVMCAS